MYLRTNFERRDISIQWKSSDSKFLLKLPKNIGLSTKYVSHYRKNNFFQTKVSVGGIGSQSERGSAPAFFYLYNLVDESEDLQVMTIMTSMMTATMMMTTTIMMTTMMMMMKRWRRVDAAGKGHRATAPPTHTGAK